jgi:hypothetical protein
MAPGLGIVESAWLFRRGAQSVRIVKVSHPGSQRSLMVLGPGTSYVTHHFDDAIACALEQCEIERRLAAREFYLTGGGSTAVPGSRFLVRGSGSLFYGSRFRVHGSGNAEP